VFRSSHFPHEPLDVTIDFGNLFLREPGGPAQGPQSRFGPDTEASPALKLLQVTIHRSGTGTDLGDLYGNLGQDVVANFESFTLDFVGMTFRLGEPLPAGNIH
jgi:hypothetical protein